MQKLAIPVNKKIPHAHEERGKAEGSRNVTVLSAPSVTKKQFSKPTRFVAIDDKETTKRIQSTWKSKGNLLEKLNRINTLIDHPLTSTDCNRAAIKCQSLVRGWLERRSICHVSFNDAPLVIKPSYCTSCTCEIDTAMHAFQNPFVNKNKIKRYLIRPMRSGAEDKDNCTRWKRRRWRTHVPFCRRTALPSTP